VEYFCVTLIAIAEELKGVFRGGWTEDGKVFRRHVSIVLRRG
jgi:hypothetical protein